MSGDAPYNQAAEDAERGHDLADDKAGHAADGHSHAAENPLFGIAAEFDDPDAILAAAKAIIAAGYTRAEAYTPQPILDMPVVLGSKRTYAAPIALFFATCGAIGGFGMQWFANVIHYSWNIGGKPPNSWPMWIPITFESAILMTGTTGVLAMLILNGLPQPYHPMFRLDSFARASKDRFFLCIESTDPKFDVATIRAMFETMHPLSIAEVPR